MLMWRTCVLRAFHVHLVHRVRLSHVVLHVARTLHVQHLSDKEAGALGWGILDVTPIIGGRTVCTCVHQYVVYTMYIVILCSLCSMYTVYIDS